VRENRAAKDGFTLVEALIILVTVCVIAAISAPRVMHAEPPDKTAAKGSLNSCRAAIREFYGDTGLYPSSLSDLVSPCPPVMGLDSAGARHLISSKTWQGPYLGSMPVDPRSAQPFAYRRTPPLVGAVEANDL